VSGVHVHNDSGGEVAKKIGELAELLEVYGIVAVITENASGRLGVIGPPSARDVLEAISEGVRKELLARGLGSPS
jgi:hypothetical protein